MTPDPPSPPVSASHAPPGHDDHPPGTDRSGHGIRNRDPSQGRQAPPGPLPGAEPEQAPGWSSIWPEPPAFRRPVPPSPIEVYELFHPRVPPALEGLTILHIADLHTTRGRPITAAVRELADALPHAPVDLVVLTGDYVDRPDAVDAGLQALDLLASRWRARLGAAAILGNHDTGAFALSRERFTSARWLRNEHACLPGLPLTILGGSYPEDLFSAALHAPPEALAPERFVLALAHYPTQIYAAARLDIPLLLAGHTHAGQWRLGPGLAPHTSCDLPGSLGTGIIRLDDTLCCITRGIGTTALHLRINCPPQAPIYVLRRGPLPPLVPGRVRSVQAW